MPKTKKEVVTKEVKKTAVKKAAPEKVKTAKVEGLTVPSFSFTGTESGILTLPENLFGAKVNKPLLAQAMRVYLNNLKSHFSNTKTRSEVKGSSRKVRVQKGTGGARHGTVRAPIFVGGGIALGPKFRKIILDLPKKMKKAALISALSDKANNKEVFGVKDLDKVSGKTAQMKDFVKNTAKKDILLVIDGKNENILRAVQNLPKVKAITADQLNTLNIISHKTLVLTPDAVEKLESRMFVKEVK